jgi:ATP-dependent protease ClpP protease subunit
MSNFKQSLVLLPLICCWAHGAFADVSTLRPLKGEDLKAVGDPRDIQGMYCMANGGGSCWKISGVISKKDVLAVRKLGAREIASEAAAEREGNYYRSPPEIYLDSGGGDIEAAMAIGRVLRQLKAKAIVTRRFKCLSACVFVLAGAVHRDFFDGDVGIHRPFSTETGYGNYEKLQNQYRRLAIAIKDYLEEMNVSPSLLESMMRVPAEQMRILSRQEAQDFGLGATDPVQQEVEDSDAATFYGISKFDYLQRKPTVASKCPSGLTKGAITDTTAYLQCVADVMKGVR